MSKNNSNSNNESKSKLPDYPVYYIIQTNPVLKICGYSLTKENAERGKTQVERITGSKSVILEFKRSDLLELNYKL
jgi:hypothetical protein